MTRGARPGPLLRRAVLALASAGAGFLLLCALGHALANPGGHLLRLLWCLVPAAAAAHLAVALSRVAPSPGLKAGLIATGHGTSRLARIAATSTGLTCALGSGVAVVLFLHLRGDLASSPLPPDTTRALGAGVPLPVAGTITLMSLVPLLGAGATLLALRPSPERPRGQRGPAEAPAAAGGIPVGLPWGAAVAGAGLVLELYAQRWQPAQPGDRVPLPGGLPQMSSMMLLGWSLTAVGFVLAGPGLVHLCGRILAAARPGALRLLAGRVLQAEATRIGRPLGVLCAWTSAGLATARLSGADPQTRIGPLTALGAGLLLLCAVATVLAAAEESRAARAPVTEALTRIGASAELLRRAALLRTGVLLAVLLPVTLMVGELAALPLL